jgi:hypothetical protein
MKSRVKPPRSSGEDGCSGFSWPDQARFVSEDDGVHAVSQVPGRLRPWRHPAAFLTTMSGLPAWLPEKTTRLPDFWKLMDAGA